MAEDPRLDRIEAKIDKLTDAFASLVRIDEQVVTLFKKQDAHDHRMERMADRLTELERITLQRGAFYKWLDRGLLAAVGAGVAMAFRRWGG